LERVTQSSWHRAELLASAQAVCYCCTEVFSPSAIVGWCDKDDEGIPQTALCPFCSVDAVVGFEGDLDRIWLVEQRRSSFGEDQK
jgi:hypothetical protein